MGLFGKKKNDQEAEDKNLESSSKNKELDIILEARKEEEAERQAKIAAREAEQEKVRSAIAADLEKSAQAAADVISLFPAREGEDRFFMLVEANVYTEPVNKGDEIVTGILRGKLRKGQEIQVLSGLDSLNRVTVDVIRNDSREIVDEASDERVELELSKGDFADADSPDQETESRVMNFSVLTNLSAEEGRSEGVRLPAMLCEFSRYQGDQQFFGQLMNAALTTEYSVPAKISGSGSSKKVSFAGLRPDKESGLPMLPAFSSFKSFEKHKAVLAQGGGFNSAIQMDFAQLCAVARDDLHGGAVVDPLGPVVFGLPKSLLDTSVKTVQFHALFGESKYAEKFVPQPGQAQQPEQKVKEYNVTKPAEGGEYNFIDQAVKKYGGSHADISRICVVVIVGRDDPDDKSYVCILDCPQDKYDMNCKGIENAVRPYLKAIKKIQFRPFSKDKFGDQFFEAFPWAYNKLGV